MARDSCTMDYTVRSCIFLGYKARNNKKLLIEIPDQCKTVENLRKLKEDCGFSYLFLPIDEDMRIRALKAGWNDESIVLNPCCNASLETIDKAVYLDFDDHSKGFRPFHAIYIDEPQKRGSGDVDIGFRNPLQLAEISNHIRNNFVFKNGEHIEFVIGDYGGWWKEAWGIIADSICYSGYRYHTNVKFCWNPFDPRACDYLEMPGFYDQRPNWWELFTGWFQVPSAKVYYNVRSC